MRTERGRRGVVTIEFALSLTVFLTLVFSLIELAHALYLWNTLADVTRQAARLAAMTDPADPAAMATLRQHALLRDGPGTLPFGAPIDASYLRIDYQWLDASGAAARVLALPACPLQNRINCLDQPHGERCIRLVRVRLCQPAADGDTGGTCGAVPYPPLLPLLDPLFASARLPIALPVSATVVLAESLGQLPGQDNGACPAPAALP